VFTGFAMAGFGMARYHRLVDSYDLATIATLKYAKSLRPTTLRAVHFSLDSARAGKLRRQWLEAATGSRWSSRTVPTGGWPMPPPGSPRPRRPSLAPT
jgi:hypothetical protein